MAAWSEVLDGFWMGNPNGIVSKSLIIWSHPPGSNRRPADYESAALPTELGWPEAGRAGQILPISSGPSFGGYHSVPPNCR